jgi:hypothetical protein
MNLVGPEKWTKRIEFVEIEGVLNVLRVDSDT